MTTSSGAGGPAARVEPERRRGLRPRGAGVVAGAEVRPVADRLAVAADDLGRVGDVADGGGDLRHRRTRSSDLGVDRRALGRPVGRVELERGLGGHDGVGAVVGGRRQAVGRAAHGVGQRERAAHHGDAEHDGQHGQRRAHRARGETSEGDPLHRAAFFITARMSASVGLLEVGDDAAVGRGRGRGRRSPPRAGRA